MEVLSLTGGACIIPPLHDAWSWAVVRREDKVLTSVRSAADHMDLTESYNTINSTGGSEDNSTCPFTLLLPYTFTPKHQTDGGMYIDE